jgi:hypothetical protein
MFRELALPTQAGPSPMQSQAPKAAVQHRNIPQKADVGGGGGGRIVQIAACRLRRQSFPLELQPLGQRMRA